MKFEETGLPNTPMLRNAFALQERNEARVQEELAGNPEIQQGFATIEHYGLSVAQLLFENNIGDEALLSYALLSNMPEETWWALAEQFGPDVAALHREDEAHFQTQHRTIEQGSDAVKLFMLAGDIVYMRALRLLAERGIVVSDNTGPFHDLLERLGEDVSSASLVAAYEKELSELDAFFGTHANGKPPIEETELLECPEVCAAYEVVVDECRDIESFDRALDAAEMLSTLPEIKNPVAIAAALLEIALPNMTEDDIYGWEKHIGTMVRRVLEEGSVVQALSPQRTKSASTSQKQVILAYLVSRMETEAASLQSLLDSGLVKDVDPGSLREAGAEFEANALSATRIVFPALKGASGAPELEEAFTRAAGKMGAALQSLQKELSSMPPRSKPRPPGKNGPST